MQPAIINNPTCSFKNTLFLSGDKSISHRAIFIGAIAEGKTRVSNFLFSDDSLVTIEAFRKLGVRITIDKKRKKVVIFGQGCLSLKKPKSALYLKESGTTIRLLSGILSGQEFSSRLIAASVLSKRPMRRISLPLRLMGAKIKARKIKGQEYPPLRIEASDLKAISYHLPIPSAQVKSAIIFAGLYAKGTTRVYEKIRSRDHTERMLKLFGANIKTSGQKITIKKSSLKSCLIDVPADISSAAFFIVLASLIAKSNLLIKSVGINPTRCGILKSLKAMGANIKISSISPGKNKAYKLEPRADIRVTAARLKAIKVKASDIPSMIDELPILMVAASLAKGKTGISGIAELRVKETDRIHSMVTNLRKMGAKIKIKTKNKKEYIEIEGIDKLRGAKLKSFGDHRTAMSMVVAGLLAEGRSILDDINCIDKSLPEFTCLIKNLLGNNSIKLG